ncbi:MAG: hypothetical protein B7X06_01360, partial [Verrucomicrobia bacterium 21-51-4]
NAQFFTVKPGELVTIYTASTEKLQPADAVLCSREGTEELEWSCDESGRILTDPLNTEPAAIFFIADGHGDPINLLESLPLWLQEHSLAMTRIITVVDAKVLSTHETELRPWFDACLHFTDYALLTHTAEVAPKWLREFTAHYQKELRYPCLFEVTKNKTAANPALILDPEIRRISMLFETADELEHEDDSEDSTSTPQPSSSNPDLALFERLSDGQRKIALADISKFVH